VVKQPLAALGTLAARTLLAGLTGAPRDAVAVALRPSLVIRHSCGALRMGDFAGVGTHTAVESAREQEELEWAHR
jgi:hypothetical protein